jgi:hypothetical protein
MKHALIIQVMISFAIIITIPIAAIASSPVKLQYIKPEELKKLMESNDLNVVVVDTQPKAAYDLGHIKGAISFPWVIDIKGPGNLPKDKLLVLYCDCATEGSSTDIFEPLTGKLGSCSSDDDSTDLAGQLMSKFGYKNIKILEGGGQGGSSWVIP